MQWASVNWFIWFHPLWVYALFLGLKASTLDKPKWVIFSPGLEVLCFSSAWVYAFVLCVHPNSWCLVYCSVMRWWILWSIMSCIPYLNISRVDSLSEFGCDQFWWMKKMWLICFQLTKLFQSIEYFKEGAAIMQRSILLAFHGQPKVIIHPCLAYTRIFS